MIIGRRETTTSPSTKAANRGEYMPVNTGSGAKGNEKEVEGATEAQGKSEMGSLKRARRDRVRADFGSDTEGGTTTGKETPGTTENEEDEDEDE